MALDALNTVDIIEAMENFTDRLRPIEEELREKLDYGYTIDGQSVLLNEIRPDCKDPRIKREYPFAKATFVKTNNNWKIFWIRANLKWYSYEPKPVVKSLEEFLQLVLEDKHHYFFG